MPYSASTKEHEALPQVRLDAIWSILTKNKTGYAHHPETLRWKGKRRALYLRHKQIVKEMKKRGFTHKSPLNSDFAIGKRVQKDFIDTIEEQSRLLRSKKCKCKV